MFSTFSVFDFFSENASIINVHNWLKWIKTHPEDSTWAAPYKVLGRAIESLYKMGFC